MEILISKARYISVLSKRPLRDGRKAPKTLPQPAMVPTVLASMALFFDLKNFVSL